MIMVFIPLRFTSLCFPHWKFYDLISFSVFATSFSPNKDTHAHMHTHMEMRMISCALMVVMWIHQCALTPPRWCGLGRGANSGSSETTLPPACLLGIRRRRHGTHYCCSDTLMLMSPNSTENGYRMLGYAHLECDRVVCQTLRD